ncbi:Asp-tRNA(Asn)/Glu-tRNA(Gln) amidotransferase subunit GatB [Candidatus Saccharibacteria bacterium]|nr:Asp-tRNA(Asn)/Glu-tRNA(Gln) amidotransferase subunit GatB [Candidatus Saccharibacteria bacterium]
MSRIIPTIGIECHVQLKTKTKLFSDTDNDARDASPNSKVSEIDYALPGMLPYLNKEAVRLACRAAKALNADVARFSMFDRKHYFYPDLPKGYQTSQMYNPIILEGYVELPSGTKVRVDHAHLEEDAGKQTHYSGYTLVDLNRAGTPLIEIVSAPDIHSAADARAYAEELHKLMTYADISHGDLYHGNMRFDVNISVSSDPDKLGTRVEIKNMNSFRAVEAAADYEISRQMKVIEAGEKVVQETRGWDDAKQKTIPQRSKENAKDYRYMPDADIPPVILSDEQIAEFQSGFPKMPAEYRAEFAVLGVDKSAVNVLLAERAIAEIVSEVLEKSDAAKAKKVANLIISTLGIADDSKKIKLPSVSDLITLAEMLMQGEINSNAGDKIFSELISGRENSRQIAKDENLIQVSDTGEVEKIVDEVLASEVAAKAIADIKAGEQKAIGFLVGLVMKESKGKANPAVVREVILTKLSN